MNPELVHEEVVILGVGGAGNNIAIQATLAGSDIGGDPRLGRVFVDTNEVDIHVARNIPGVTKADTFLLGEDTLGGRGSGFNPDAARREYLKSRDKILRRIAPVPVVIVAGSATQGTGRGVFELLLNDVISEGKWGLGVFVESCPTNEVGPDEHDEILAVMRRLKEKQIRFMHLVNAKIFERHVTLTQAEAFASVNASVGRGIYSFARMMSEGRRMDWSNFARVLACGPDGCRFFIGWGGFPAVSASSSKRKSTMSIPTPDEIQTAAYAALETRFLGFNNRPGYVIMAVHGNYPAPVVGQARAAVNQAFEARFTKEQRSKYRLLPPVAFSDDLGQPGITVLAMESDGNDHEPFALPKVDREIVLVRYRRPKTVVLTDVLPTTLPSTPTNHSLSTTQADELTDDADVRPVAAAVTTASTPPATAINGAHSASADAMLAASTAVSPDAQVAVDGQAPPAPPAVDAAIPSDSLTNQVAAQAPPVPAIEPVVSGSGNGTPLVVIPQGMATPTPSPHSGVSTSSSHTNGNGHKVNGTPQVPVKPDLIPLHRFLRAPHEFPGTAVLLKHPDPSRFRINEEELRKLISTMQFGPQFQALSRPWRDYLRTVLVQVRVQDVRVRVPWKKVLSRQVSIRTLEPDQVRQISLVTLDEKTEPEVRFLQTILKLFGQEAMYEVQGRPVEAPVSTPLVVQPIPATAESEPVPDTSSVVLLGPVSMPTTPPKSKGRPWFEGARRGLGNMGLPQKLGGLDRS